MNATEIQKLSSGDKVKYLGKTLTVTDWKCHKDVVMLGNERIWAEPCFDGKLIHPAFWKEIEPICSSKKGCETHRKIFLKDIKNEIEKDFDRT